MKSVVRLCGVLLIALSTNQAFGLFATWGGAGGGSPTDWNNPGNWTTGDPLVPVPTAADQAFIINAAIPGPVITGTQAISIGRIVHDGGGTIDIQAGGSITNGGQYVSGNSAAPVNTLTVDGVFTNSADIMAIGTNPGGKGALVVNGTVNVSGPWLIAGFSGPGAVGDITVNAGGQLNVSSWIGIGWSGNGTLTVNGGSVLDSGIMNAGVNNAAATGDIFLNSGSITSAGLNLGNNVGSASLLIGDGATYTNNAGFLQTPGSAVTFGGAGTGQFIFTASPLADVQAVILGSPSSWIFPDGPSITGSLGNVVVTNVPEPLTLSLLAFGAGVLLRRKKFNDDLCKSTYAKA